MTTPKHRPTCANCDKEMVAEYRPFCSRRCADIDLGHWFNESYAIPAVEPPDEWDEEQ
jgi:endogenous inhibitor of DNA gyrase (YacG/DUF329 family)